MPRRLTALAVAATAAATLTLAACGGSDPLSSESPAAGGVLVQPASSVLFLLPRLLRPPFSPAREAR